MTADPAPEDATLAAVMHRYALQAPTRQLGAEVGIGLVVLTAAFLIRPSSWIVLLCLGAGCTMLGTWAWADRAVERANPGAARLWRVVRSVAAIVGVSAALVTAFAGVASLLGTWIS